MGDADAGGLDGDGGGINLVLRSFNQGFSPVPVRIEELWKANHAILLIRQNTLRQ